MPRDPFDIFFGRGGNDKNDGRRDGHDPFNDPFFRQFSDMSRHMDQIFEEFFKDSFDIPNSRSHPNFNGAITLEPPSSRVTNHDHDSDRPDLSKINPNIPQRQDSIEENDKVISRRDSRNRFDGNDVFGGIPRIFRHFFEPEYDEPSLSDVNPNFSNGNNGAILNDKEKDSNLIHPNGPPPGFRSPYLPNWNGEEKSLPKEQSFFRSQSVVISTTPDGKTTKRTTIRDENGNIEESTETYDNSIDGSKNSIDFPFGFGGMFPRRMIDFGYGNGNDNDNENNGTPSLHGDILNNNNNENGGRNNDQWLYRPTDPFGSWRNKIDSWKSRWKSYWLGYGDNNNNNNNNNGNYKNNFPSPFGWGNKRDDEKSSEWFYGSRDRSNDDDKCDNNGSKIEWKSNYNNYRRRPNQDASKLRDEIIKTNNEDDKNKL